MTDAAARYADWKAPSQDSQILIWPESHELSSATGRNQKLFAQAADVRVQNIPLGELRKAAREFVHHNHAQPLISSGHQTELYHPGVWSKDVLACALAAKLDGAAYHFAVDTDAPKHLHLRWPGVSEVITDDDAIGSANSCLNLANPSPKHLHHLRERFEQASSSWNFQPTLSPFFDAMQSALLGHDSLAWSVAHAIQQVDTELQLNYALIAMSPIWNSLPFLVLVHHWLANAHSFALQYNKSLAAYRLGHSIRTHARPMPDLAVSSDRQSFEAPFWVDELSNQSPYTGQRHRLLVERKGQQWVFVATATRDEFAFDPFANGWEAAEKLLKFLRKNLLMISPRALTLTMYLRVFLSDLFIHGIGGGRYDQVTDQVIQKQLNIPAPEFAVTTATMYFPAALEQHRVNLHPLVQEGRRIRHGMLSKEKRTMAQTIHALPRKSRQRQEMFFQMHEYLSHQSRSPDVLGWENRLKEAEQLSHLQRPLFDRELFFAIQSKERLNQLIEKYRSAIG